MDRHLRWQAHRIGEYTGQSHRQDQGDEKDVDSGERGNPERHQVDW
jgi:hypothetical protein